MKVHFDYLQGPVLGHKRRCEVLQRELVERGHTIVDKYPDWNIVDYPEDQIPGPQVLAMHHLLMGYYPRYPFDYAWHPLGEPREDTLTGVGYIIVSDAIKYLNSCERIEKTLVACGGADPFHLTSVIASYLFGYDVVIGPNANNITVNDADIVYVGLTHQAMIETMAKYQTIICTWGGTVFEACALNCAVIPITLYPEHEVEARKLGIPYLTKEDIISDPRMLYGFLKMVTPRTYEIDTKGAERVCKFMESKIENLG